MYPAVQQHGLGKRLRDTAFGRFWTKLRPALLILGPKGAAIIAAVEVVMWAYDSTMGSTMERFENLSAADEAILNQWNDNLFIPKIAELSNTYRKIVEGTLNEVAVDFSFRIINAGGTPVVGNPMSAQAQINALNGLLKQVAALRAALNHNNMNLSSTAMSERTTYVEIITKGIEKQIVNTLLNFDFPLIQSTVYFKNEEVSFGALTPFGLKVSFEAIQFTAQGVIPSGTTVNLPTTPVVPGNATTTSDATETTETRSNSKYLGLIVIALLAAAVFSPDKKK